MRGEEALRGKEGKRKRSGEGGKIKNDNERTWAATNEILRARGMKGYKKSKEAGKDRDRGTHARFKRKREGKEARQKRRE